jgi:hypothetical protein
MGHVCQVTNLISFATMARIQDDVGASVVKASFITSDFTRLAEHPVLLRGEKRANVRRFLMNKLRMKRNLFG